MSLSGIEEIGEQIKKEIRLDELGRGFISVRGAARLADVDDESIRKALESADQKPASMAKFLIEQGFDGAEQSRWRQSGIPDVALASILKYYAYVAQDRYRRKQARLIDSLLSSVTIRTWMQQMKGWHQKADVAAIQDPRSSNISEAIKLLEDLQKSIAILEEQLEAGHALLQSGNAMVRSLHNAIHNQGGSLNKAEAFLRKAKASLNGIGDAIALLDGMTKAPQLALPPVEEHPVQRTATERRQSVIAFLFDLVAEYGSLEAIPRRRKGRPTANLEADWGSAKLSKQFGLCANTILDIWDEVDEAIKQHGVTGARNRLLI